MSDQKTGGLSPELLKGLRELVDVLEQSDEGLAKAVAERAQELKIDEEKALLELILLGLEQVGKLPWKPDVRRAWVQPKLKRYFLKIGTEMYEMMAPTAREALIEQLRRWGANQAAVGAPELGIKGQWVFEVIGFEFRGEPIKQVEVFTRYPREADSKRD